MNSVIRILLIETLHKLLSADLAYTCTGKINALYCTLIQARLINITKYHTILWIH